MTTDTLIRIADGPSPSDRLTIRLPSEPATHPGQVVLLEGGGFGVVADEHETIIRRIGERDWTWAEAMDFANRMNQERKS